MSTPSIQTLITQAQQVLNLKSSNEIRATLAAILANANVGTPLNPNLTTQQLWDEFYEIVRQPTDDIMSIITDQMMRMVFSPPAPGGAGADKQVIFNDNGVLVGDPGLTFNKTTDKLTVATTIDISRGLLNDPTSTGVGENTLDATTAGAIRNTAIGHNSMYRATTANNNVAVGINTMAAVGMTASNNVAVGASSGLALTTGGSNTAVGSNALNSNATGIGNTAVGASALAAATVGDLTAVGASALTANTTGIQNTAIGRQALAGVIGSNDNTALGYQAAKAITTASGVTAIGSNALVSSTSGTNNTAVGNAALGLSTVTGGSNTSVGASSGNALTSGTANTILGFQAGQLVSTGSSNIAIGTASSFSAFGISNELVLGSAVNFVATNGAAATYFPTATAGAVVAGNPTGFIRIYLNGTFVKIPVYGN